MRSGYRIGAADKDGRFRQTTQKVGIGLCVLGAVLLLAVGAVMLAVPDAADRLNESSAVTLNGSGLLLVLCVLFMAAGLVLILRKKVKRRNCYEKHGASYLPRLPCCSPT